jgi:hypothetical protein
MDQVMPNNFEGSRGEAVINFFIAQSDNKYRIIPFNKVLYVQRVDDVQRQVDDVIENETPETEIWVNMGHRTTIALSLQEGTHFMNEYTRWLQSSMT